MTDQTMTPLRRRLIEDMTVRNFVEKTQKDYIRHGQEPHHVPGPIAGDGHGRGSAPLPTAPDRQRGSPADHQRCGFGTAVLLLLTIAADPKHLGARVGVTSVLHTWGSALTHHPHIHMIVPGGGISLDGTRWVSCRPGFFLPVRVLSRLFRRLFLDKLRAAHGAGRLNFFGDHAPLAERKAFAAYLAPLRTSEWVVYSKRPFGGPEAVLAYLSRYTHRVTIANSRLIAFDDRGVTFKWKDYRSEGPDRFKTMTLPTDEFIRRFLIHVLPSGFHRIRHYGLFANGSRFENIARARELLNAPACQNEASNADAVDSDGAEPPTLPHPCPCCGGRMTIIETFARGCSPRTRPTTIIRIDTS